MLETESLVDEAIDYMARTIWGEARGEPLEGRQAVGFVIFNRAKRDFKRVKRECIRPWQFSCWNKNDPNRAKLLKLKRGQKTFDECWAVADMVISGALPDNTEGATHYHTIAKPAYAKTWPPYWVPSLTKTVTIGHHIFYK